MGEEVSIEDQESEVIGFVYISEEAAMKVSYRVSGRRARIIKQGPFDNEVKLYISTSLFDRFIRDEFFQALSLLLAFIIGLLTVIGPFQTVYHAVRKSNQSK